MRKLKEEGVHFQSPIDGSPVYLTPEISMQMQRVLGSDIVMAFDECTPYPATRDQAEQSMALSMRWAKRSKEGHGDNPRPYLASSRVACITIYAHNPCKNY